MSKYTILGTDVNGIETIKGNGWDINNERIELNGINATFNYELDCKYISLSGPAVEDIFKCLQDLIKVNEALSEKNEMLAKEHQGLKKFCEEQREYFNAKIEKRDGYIEALKKENDEKTENYNRLQDAYVKFLRNLRRMNDEYK